jgi:hypothetical protein
MTLEQHERNGRPLGDNSFVMALEHQTGRTLAPRKVGRKRKAEPPEMRIVSPDSPELDFGGGAEEGA